MRSEAVVAAGQPPHGCVLWEEDGDFAAHVAAVKRALGPAGVSQLLRKREEEVVKQLMSLPGLAVERSFINKDKETALQFKEQGNDFFRWVDLTSNTIFNVVFHNVLFQTAELSRCL